MSTIGWLLILFGTLFARAAIKGRASHIGGDLSDAFIATVSGDTKGLMEVFARTGDPDVASAVEDTTPTAGSKDSSALVTAARDLGGKAKGYLWGATGPNYYDCSGLMWAAMKQTGQYTGSRFYTGTFVHLLGSKAVKVDTPKVGDIVLWPLHHMGVYTGPDKFYSARSVRSGIGESKISTFGLGVPSYYHVP